MSDFIYSSIPCPEGRLAERLRSIYPDDPPGVDEFHGGWGSLGVSRNLYGGFGPLETETHLAAVVGGPVLGFRDNSFLTGDDPRAGTRAVFERWRAGELRWERDLSGPFVVLVVDKAAGRVSFATDLMLFIRFTAIAAAAR
jgi:hypothetical protein